MCQKSPSCILRASLSLTCYSTAFRSCAFHRRTRYSCIYIAPMSSALNRISALLVSHARNCHVLCYTHQHTHSVYSTSYISIHQYTHSVYSTPCTSIHQHTHSVYSTPYTSIHQYTHSVYSTSYTSIHQYTQSAYSTLYIH